MLLAFAPFILFVIVERPVGMSAGLAAAAVSTVLLARDLDGAQHIGIVSPLP
jgi:hypothetical protein